MTWRQVKRLEDHVLRGHPEGQILLDTSHLPKTEQELYNEAFRIAELVDDKTATKDQIEIVHKAGNWLFIHTFRLFQEFLAVELGIADNKIAKMELQERLMWLITDFPKEYEFINQCCAIDENETLTNEERIKAQEALANSKPIKPFSLESWIDFQDNVMFPIQRDMILKERGNPTV